jgi:protein-L-isoaspartate(D-aspartate) O-methyltransferase
MNFEQARANMVDSQIHTMGVVSEPVLQAFRTLPREKFLPPEKRAVAYCDEDIALGADRWIMEPQVLARLVQGSEPKSGDVVMVVGAGCGYTAAVYSSLATTVIALDESGPLMEAANQVWQDLGLINIVSLEGDISSGSAIHSPYDLIFVNGAVATIPATLKAQMAIGGRLITVVRETASGSGRATLVLRTGEDSWSSRVLFDASIPYLPKMQPRNEFVF